MNLNAVTHDRSQAWCKSVTTWNYKEMLTWRYFFVHLQVIIAVSTEKGFAKKKRIQVVLGSFESQNEKNRIPHHCAQAMRTLKLQVYHFLWGRCFKSGVETIKNKPVERILHRPLGTTGTFKGAINIFIYLGLSYISVLLNLLQPILGCLPQLPWEDR